MTRNTENALGENYKKFNFFEEFSFRYAWNGWRGSQILWALSQKFSAKSLQSDSRVVFLPSGFKMFNRSKDWTARSIYEGTYERALLHFLDSLKINDLVIDVGANIGVTLWHSLKNSKANATYLAFEPSEQCFGDLEFTGKQIPNDGKVFKFALGEENANQKLYGVNNEKHSGLASLVQRENQVGDSVTVQVKMLDSVLETEKMCRVVSLLKIDTEGYEEAVLRGSKLLLASRTVEVIVLEVSPNFSDTSYLHDLDRILGVSYVWFMIEETGLIKRRPTLRKISLIDALNHIYQFNIAIIREDKLESYAREAHSIKLIYG
jgi:FkbM family methyltransferase